MSQIPPAPHSVSRPRANARSRRRRRQLTWSTWLLWPFATVIFGSMPLFVPFVLSTGATPLVADYGGTVAGIGAWAAPAFAKGFDALGVLATLLVAVAAMRGFPGARLPLSDRSDVLIDTLATVSYVTLLLIGALVVPVLASSPGTASETLLLWVCAWGVMIIALGVGGSMSPREAYLRERARHARLLHGVPTTSAAPPTRRALVLAVATAVSLPLLTWSACCVAVAVVDGRFWPHVPFLLVLAFGSYLALIGWFVLADRTSRPFDRIAATTLVW
ncbi:hypothetical protein [Microbacterium sp. No. 7]|uniref:hypothetical protein n=1 Tax=Microbacterium sp. No. 7 TaxID=1714373 RepID=UPI0006D27120|nr:hypothetical protein [Microbacterium sp. No. 7]ALJ18803.1 hypothetical protein AOA12_02290 [Microbacterium sp. No. 7]